MSYRGDVVRRAATLIEGERSKTHGDPRADMTCAAALIEVYEEFAKKKYLPEHDEAIHRILGKVARIACGSFHEDHYVDIAGYAGIAAEMAREYDE